jgi:hypothetical protein
MKRPYGEWRLLTRSLTENYDPRERYGSVPFIGEGQQISVSSIGASTDAGAPPLNVKACPPPAIEAVQSARLLRVAGSEQPLTLCDPNTTHV